MTNDNRGQFEKTNTRLQRLVERRRRQEGCFILFIVLSLAIAGVIALVHKGSPF